MKITKKIFTTFLAMLMVVLMMPVSAKADGAYSYTITGKEGYTFSVYKIANINLTTGEYEWKNAASTEVGNILKKSPIDTAALLAEADKLTEEQLGSAVGTIMDSSKETKDVDAGVYYVKATSVPPSVKSVKNSVFALPYMDKEEKVHNAIEFNAGTKVEDDTPAIDVKFTNDPTKSEISEFIGEDISFTIKASVLGSESMKLQSYAITDTMSKGLEWVGNSNVSVKLTGSESFEEKNLVANTDYTLNYTTVNGVNTLTVTLADQLLANDQFYSYSDVEIIYNARLNDDAVKGKENGNTNTNKATLAYTNALGISPELSSDPKNIYTYDVSVKLVDSNDNEKTIKDSKATFTVYTDDSCNTVATNGSTVSIDKNTGVATFHGFKDGWYYIKQNTAPKGYNLNNSVFPIVVDGAASTATITVQNTPLTVPETGEKGTIMFTISGLVLMLGAGVLFLMLMRKKTAK